ncbi:hypothetical protein ACQ7HM_19335 [Williamsia sp. MIQD14]|uniref:hypothetical protein n=1 Tax=Williamsia sp. MIQD14 TaxID=3425703 RepID=UPI003DA171BD
MTSTAHDTHDPIPDITTALDPFGSADQLRDRWRALLGPLGFDDQVLWFAFVDLHGRIIPALNQLPLPSAPNGALVDQVMERLADIIDAQSSVRVAFLITRPGTDATTPADREWSRLLAAAAVRVGVDIEPVFRANATDVVLVPAQPVSHRAVA